MGGSARSHVGIFLILLALTPGTATSTARAPFELIGEVKVAPDSGPAGLVLETTRDPGPAHVHLAAESLVVLLRDRGPARAVETTLAGTSNAMGREAWGPGSSYAIHLDASGSLVKVSAEAARTHVIITNDGMDNVVEIHASEGASDLTISIENTAAALDLVVRVRGEERQFRMGPAEVWTWPPPEASPVVGSTPPAQGLDPLEREYLQSGIYANWAVVGMAVLTALLVLSSILVTLYPRIADWPLGRAMASVTRQSFPLMLVVLPLVALVIAFMR